MSLPYPNPADPSYPSPYFQDNAFVRGDQMRGNNQFIWLNLASLDTRTTATELNMSYFAQPGKFMAPRYGGRQVASSTNPWHPIAVDRTFSYANAPDFCNALRGVEIQELGGLSDVTAAIHTVDYADGVQKLTISAADFAPLLDIIAARAYTVYGYTPQTTATQVFATWSANTTNDEATLARHSLTTGDPVVYAGSSAAGGLLIGGKYYVRVISSSVVTLHPTAADAIANTNKINLPTASIILDALTPRASVTTTIIDDAGHLLAGTFDLLSYNPADNSMLIGNAGNSAGGAITATLLWYKHRISPDDGGSVRWFPVVESAIVSPSSATENGMERPDRMQGHRHNIGTADNGGSASQAGIVSVGVGNNWVGTGASFASQALYVGDPRSDGTNGTPRTGATTRPRSLVVDWCIYVGANTL